MTGTTVHIVKTGSANLASVRAAFDRIGVTTTLTSDPAEIWTAERLVLPGVGAFGAAMDSLRAAGLVQPLRDRIAAGKPTLAICLGLQLLAETSEESPGVTGLGAIPDRVTRIAAEGWTTPQMGWNRVHATSGAALLADQWVYYANSYRLERIPAGWEGAMSEYGGPLVAAIERGRVLACQFHPELSGPAGLALMERWVTGAPAANGLVTSDTNRASPVRIIPCLDVRDGRVVKGVKFQNLRDAGDPVQHAAEYERQGADELVMLDVSATPEGRKTAAETISKIRRVLSIPLTVGGGVRAIDDAGRLLDAGADKVGVNTAAVERPELIAELAQKFGRQCVVLAIDAAMVDGAHDDRHDHNHAVTWEVVVQSGKVRTRIDAPVWAERGVELGAGEILLTSFDRDGTGEGYDLDLLRAISSSVRVPVIASGGARTAEHLSAAIGAGAHAVLAASIFHDGVHTVGEIKRELAGLGVSVRRETTA